MADRPPSGRESRRGPRTKLARPAALRVWVIKQKGKCQMIPKVNLNFALRPDDAGLHHYPAPLTWLHGGEPWELGYSIANLTSRPYIRQGILVLTWRPWGVLVLRRDWPVMAAADESGEYLRRCALAFGEYESDGDVEGRMAAVTDAARQVMHRAVHLLAEDHGSILLPSIAQALTRRGLPLGSAVPALTPDAAESLPVAPTATGKRKGRKSK